VRYDGFSRPMQQVPVGRSGNRKQALFFKPYDIVMAVRNRLLLFSVSDPCPKKMKKCVWFLSLGRAVTRHFLQKLQSLIPY